MFLADLHVHSRFSRACSKNCDIPGLAWWALRKGVTVAGTGDFTHPAWAAELREQLVPAEPGLLRLRPDLEEEVRRTSARSCGQEVRFLLSAEISTIYRRADRTRKVHHLLYAPSFDAAEQITAALARIGNLASDGRPILGLDSRDLLEITLSGGPGCFLIPAHIWTPWFAVLGSKSGFDTVGECYADLAGEVFAIETGLSSDPPMNWSCSFLDSYRLVSNSDAHSPPMLGREATVFSTELDYFAMAGALRTGAGLEGTINFYPEGGRYHLDGHRKCGVRCEPADSRTLGGNCPACGKPLTIGVLHRVTELADRPAGFHPPGAAGYANLVSLPEILGEIRGVGPKSKQVDAEAARLVAALGPELAILREIPADEVSRAGGSLLGEAVARLRRGEVTREAGYDGEYGVIRVFRPGELTRAATLFDVPAPRPAEAATGLAGARDGTEGDADGPAGANSGRRRRAGTRRPAHGHGAGEGAHQASEEARGAGQDTGGAAGSILAGLDPDQQAAAAAASPLMIIAGPGTGKTRTLTHRIAAAVAERGVPPESCLAITFTRRAAQELRDRLAALLPGRAAAVTITTFHGLGLAILREHPRPAGLTAEFTVAGEETVRAVAAEVAGSEQAAAALLAAADPAGRELLTKALAARDLVSFDGLLDLPLELLRAGPELAARLRERWPVLSVDEYQDIDARQYELLRLLAGDGSGLTVIGDPDQAIYGFRGSDVRFFQRFSEDYPGAAAVELTRNYRSAPAILSGALQAVAPATLVPGRTLRPAAAPSPAAAGAGAAAAAWPDPGRVTLHEAADEHAEAAWIGQAVDRLLGGASFHSLDSGRADGHATGGLTLASIAVLYRTDAQAGPLGQGLTRAGLPWQKRSHDRLTRRSAVPDVAGELRLAGPDGTAGSPVASRLQAVVRKLAEQAPLRGLAAVDVLAAGEVLAPLARRCGSDLERFLTELALGAEADSLDPRADAITLLTLHAAKGLEFDVVFLAGCERGLLPLRLPGAAPADGDPAEERRLLFVGMTRARRHLFLSCAATRHRHGATLPGGPSPFLTSIDPALLDRSTPTRPRRPPARQLKLL
ncbi:MAG: UvrD-helicase domain-containing protein [Gemmatimonadota bacterium]